MLFAIKHIPILSLSSKNSHRSKEEVENSWGWKIFKEA